MKYGIVIQVKILNLDTYEKVKVVEFPYGSETKKDPQFIHEIIENILQEVKNKE